MYNINTVMIEGEVTDEPKVIAEKDGDATIVSSRIKHVKSIGKGKDITSWFTIKGYGKFASLVEALRVGDHVVVYGVLRQERYKSRSGQMVYSVVIEPMKILLAKCATTGILSDKDEDDIPDVDEADEVTDF